MGITRNGPVMNMDTQQPILMPHPSQRLTRSKLHRLLTVHKIRHNPGGTLDELYNVMLMNNIQLEIVPPGVLSKPPIPVLIKRPEPSDPRIMANDGWPRSVFTLRKICKERNIPVTKKHTRESLIKLLKGDGYGQ